MYFAGIKYKILCILRYFFIKGNSTDIKRLRQGLLVVGKMLVELVGWLSWLVCRACYV